MHGVLAMAKTPPPPPPPPPPPKAKKGPPPPPKTKKAPPPSPPPKTKKSTKGPRKGGKKPSAASKKRGRRIKIKLGLKQNRLTEQEDTYSDQVGWTVSQEILEPLDFDEEDKKPEVVNHQCSMCGSIMQIPQPKRERYKVICAYSECGHEDMIGI